MTLRIETTILAKCYVTSHFSICPGGETKTEPEREQLRQPGPRGAHEGGLQDAQAKAREGPHALQPPVQFYEEVHRTFQVHFLRQGNFTRQ